MPNTTSAKKALRASRKKNEVNSARRNRIRTFARKVLDAIKSADKLKAGEAFRALESEIMRGVKKNILKLNTATRRLSRIAAAIKKI